ncbi:MAG: hypothetical protein R2728_13860 [Chitinophagales bacterium]
MVKGDLAGKLVIGGSLSAPDVDGTLSLNDAGTEVISLGSYYTVKKGDFDISKDNIDVKAVFVDSKQRIANLTGNITHNYFSNIGFNLNFSAKSFTFLDPKQKNLPFYGKLNAELDADITAFGVNKPKSSPYLPQTIARTLPLKLLPTVLFLMNLTSFL